MKLGINGLGRIGKLLLWNEILEKRFDGAVVNIGRKVGRSDEDLLDYLLHDSTYGNLSSFLYGFSKECSAEISEEHSFLIDGFPVKVLCETREPSKIGWDEEKVRLVVDCTGKFRDPAGEVRGHLAGGAEKVIVSAPFKGITMPEDTITLIYGVNNLSFKPKEHNIISAASCTTTALAHMVKPLLEDERTSKILTASMTTVHAATNTQSILDSVPKDGAKDLRKSRSIFDNLIMTSTGAERALEEVLPQVMRIGFMADSVRVPTSTVSMISLNVTFNCGEEILNRDYINDVYKKSAGELLKFSERQNVSSDMKGLRAAVVIEGRETHTRTGFLEIKENAVKVPVTHAKIFGWYDNEFGSYVYCLGNLAYYITQRM